MDARRTLARKGRARIGASRQRSAPRGHQRRRPHHLRARDRDRHRVRHRRRASRARRDRCDPHRRARHPRRIGRPHQRSGGAPRRVLRLRVRPDRRRRALPRCRLVPLERGPAPAGAGDGRPRALDAHHLRAGAGRVSRPHRPWRPHGTRRAHGAPGRRPRVQHPRARHVVDARAHRLHRAPTLREGVAPGHAGGVATHAAHAGRRSTTSLGPERWPSGGRPGVRGTERRADRRNSATRRT